MSVLTNYGFSLKCGNFARFMKKYGYLIYFSADAMEQINDDMNVITHRHSQNGGSAGRGDGQRMATLCEPIYGHAIRCMVYMTGKDKEIIGAHNAHVAEELAKKIQRLIRIRMQYKRTANERVKIAATRVKTAAKRNERMSRNASNPFDDIGNVLHVKRPRFNYRS